MYYFHLKCLDTAYVMFLQKNFLFMTMWNGKTCKDVLCTILEEKEKPMNIISKSTNKGKNKCVFSNFFPSVWDIRRK